MSLIVTNLFLNLIKALNVCKIYLVLNIIKVQNVIRFGPKCNKPLVLNLIKAILHLRPDRETSNVIKVPERNQGARKKVWS